MQREEQDSFEEALANLQYVLIARRVYAKDAADNAKDKVEDLKE